MAMSMGKRKREDDEGDSEDDTEDGSNMKALFQKAFEAKFKPLPPPETRPSYEEQPVPDEDSNDSDESEWDGLPEDNEQVEVIDHDASRLKDLVDEIRERKSFMASRCHSTPIELN